MSAAVKNVRLQPDGFESAEAAPDRLRTDAEMDIRRIRFLADVQVLIDVLERMNRLALRLRGMWLRNVRLRGMYFFHRVTNLQPACVRKQSLVCAAHGPLMVAFRSRLAGDQIGEACAEQRNEKRL